MNMLVADDAMPICSGIKEGIDWSRYGISEVLTAYDGTTALELFHQHRPEIVIADIRMAGLNGLELSREILRLCDTTRIILLSAYSEFEYAREALQMGVFAYELKPLRVDALVHKVEEAIESWKRLIKKDDAEAKYARICRDQTLERMLTGEIMDARSMKRFFEEQYGLSADCAYLTAVFSEESDQDESKVLRGLMNRMNGVYLTCMNGRHIALLPCPRSLSELEKMIVNLRWSLQAVSAFPFSCGVSSRGTLPDLKEMLAQAEEALALRFYTGPNTLNRWSGDAMFSREEIPCNGIMPLEKEGDAMSSWEEIEGRINGWFDDIGQRRPYAAPARVHEWTLEWLRNLRQQIRQWLGEDDGDLTRELQTFEHGGVLPFFSQYRAAVLGICRNTYDRYFASDGSTLNNFALRCRFYINRHYTRDLRVQEMAEYFCISPNYFSHLFKKMMGVPFKQYLNAVRIKQANILLEQGHFQAAEVARAVGFVDYKYFHHVYRKYMNRAPTRAPSTKEQGRRK